MYQIARNMVIKMSVPSNVENNNPYITVTYKLFLFYFHFVYQAGSVIAV